MRAEGVSGVAEEAGRRVQSLLRAVLRGPGEVLLGGDEAGRVSLKSAPREVSFRLDPGVMFRLQRGQNSVLRNSEELT